LLLNSQILLWWLFEDPKLKPPIAEFIEAPKSEVFVSVVSVWEISIKKHLGKLEAPDDLPRQLRRNNFQTININIAHAQAAGALPLHHRDPSRSTGCSWPRLSLSN
jgi:PIN domain nuclease of toxin-antitoxin system